MNKYILIIMGENSIFISHTENTNDIAGKMTMTDLMNRIPENATTEKLKDWNKKYNTEWRWRFLKLEKERKVVEISLVNSSNNKRIYFNRYGEWVEREVSPIFDRFVEKTLYYYAEK